MTNLGELLDGFRHYAWRLEALDTYDIGDERAQFEQFLAGRTPDPSEDDLEWQARARTVMTSGRSIGRVRVVGHPITDYTRFEWAAYPANIHAGEDVRILDRSWLDKQDTRWNRDFWLFDDRIAALMNYDASGQFLGITITTDVQPYLEIRAEALRRSVPFDQYTLPRAA